MRIRLRPSTNGQTRYTAASAGQLQWPLNWAKGPIVAALQKYDFLVLFPINPTTLAKYREAFQPSGAKDDPADAELALDLLVRHPERFSPLRLQSAAMRSLVSLVERRRQLVGDQNRLINRLCDTLKQYYPQALEWFDDRGTVLFCDFLERWPTLRSVRQARTAVLETFFHAHHCRSASRISARIESIRAAAALTDDPAIIGPCRLHLLALVAQLRAVLAAIAQFDREIAAVVQTLPDYALFEDLPGAGFQLAPRLLAAFGEQRERLRSAEELQKYAGIAPVTERSGKKSWVHWRLQCPKFVRQTFVEWAAQTISRSFWAGAYYRQQRAKGSSHHVALRALAFKWIRILYRCWQTRTTYNETVYLNALSKRGSPPLANLSQLPG
ncbi:IS110 family transposase ISCps4 [Paraburkholderia ultramafica]|uniref:IS110 family transposase ISCps4 n=1 Tax=Paraburkholderia ultramafica TaxID=1544867 RepID=A0A6S7BR53_9BURK|nr:IS110 family transposase ISCps4 [Paraburkholderia ultramafica]